MKHPCTLVSFSMSINGIFLCTQGDEKTPLCYVLCLVAQSCPTLWSFALWPCQTPLSMRFFRQEDWSGFPFPPPGGNTFTFGQNMMESTQNIFCLIIVIIQMPSSNHLFYHEEHKHLERLSALCWCLWRNDVLVTLPEKNLFEYFLERLVNWLPTLE